MGKAGKAALDVIRGAQPEAAEAIEETLVDTEVLLTWSKRAVQSLLREVSVDDLAVFLFSESDAIATHLLEGMSTRAQGLFAETMTTLAPPTKEQQARARDAVFEAARRVRS